MDVVPTVVADLLQQGPNACSDFSVDVIQLLTERGYLLSSADEEADIIHRLISSADEYWSKRIHLNFCTTLGCNLSCSYCFESHLRHEPTVDIITEDQVIQGFNLLDILLEQRTPDIVTIGIFGGEPLQSHSLEAVKDVVVRSTHRNLPVTITTNGVSLESYKMLLSNYKSNTRLKITLDGPAHIHDKRRRFRDGSGTYDLIVSNIDEMLHFGVGVEVQVNLDNQNIDSVNELFEVFEERGWPLFPQFSCTLNRVSDRSLSVIPGIMSEDELARALVKNVSDYSGLRGWINVNAFTLLRHPMSVLTPDIPGIFSHPVVYYCEATSGSSIFLAPNGLIYLCPSSLGCSELSVGRYFPKIEWDTDKLALWNRPISQLNGCASCEISFVCGGGCAIRSYRDKRDIRASDCNDARGILSRYLQQAEVGTPVLEQGS
jgi:uncharacterized protein